MELQKRKTIRLQDYDYCKDNAYFVTICTQNHNCLFGVCRDAPCGCPQITLSTLGELAQKNIKVVEEKFNVNFLEYVVMPNHIHAIIWLHNNGHPQGASLQQVVGGYKSLVSNEWLKFCKIDNKKMGEVWQRSFFEHIIRDKASYLEIVKYINENPVKWQYDEYYKIKEYK